MSNLFEALPVPSPGDPTKVELTDPDGNLITATAGMKVRDDGTELWYCALVWRRDSNVSPQPRFIVLNLLNQAVRLLTRFSFKLKDVKLPTIEDETEPGLDKY